MNNKLLYKDPSENISERVEDLLGRMTLDEKAAQLGCFMSAVFWNGKEFSDDAMKYIIGNGLGQCVMMDGSGAQDPFSVARNITAIQKFLVEKTRLGIPTIPHAEAISGLTIPGATNFPAAISLGATWDPEAIKEMADIIRDQMLAVGYKQALSPVMDVCRDPRWGRVGETYGEDPYLVSSMAAAFVKGLQSDNLGKGVIATGKHFLGYAFSEGGLNQGTQRIPDRELYEVYARPFETAIKESGLFSIMNTYGDIDGVPVCTSEKYFTEMLRGTMGFKGIAVSDYMSLERVFLVYGVAEDLKDAGVQCFKAGIDMELPMPKTYGTNLIEAIKEGKIEPGLLDRSVRRVLEAKFRLGLFENPYPAVNAIAEVFSNPRNVDITSKLAAESMVLLKNEANLLPLSKDIRSIGVIGPNADSLRNLFGCYTTVAQLEMFVDAAVHGTFMGMEGVDLTLFGMTKEVLDKFRSMDIEEATAAMFPRSRTILQAIKEKVSGDTQVFYAQGCSIMGDSRGGFDEAMEVARKSDTVIMVMGGKYGWGLSNTSGEGIDSSSIGFFGVQEEMIKAVAEIGKPIVLVQTEAKPISSKWAYNNIPAILQAWIPGQEGGKIIADTLFGDLNPGGKMPMTVARSAGQIPSYYNHPNGSGYTYKGLNAKGYINESHKPLYYFGHGLSYTAFQYNKLEISKARVNSTGSVDISFDLKNTGERTGDEVVQLYLKDIAASVVRPVKELEGFKRITLNPGETARVTFTIKMNQLGFYDREMNFVVEPGYIQVMVGASSEDIRLTGEFEIIGTKVQVLGNRSYLSAVKVTKLAGIRED